MKNNKDTLTKGNYYTRVDLGLKGADFRKSHVAGKGEQFLFITIKNGKYLNELHSDGVVHEAKPKDLAHIEPKNNEKYKGRHIMVRYLPKVGSPYEYIGDELYITRFDLKRNKIFIE